MISIPIIFGWLRIHRKEQLLLSKHPILVCHWNKAGWMRCGLYSKRLFCWGKDRQSRTDIDDWSPWWNTP